MIFLKRGLSYDRKIIKILTPIIEDLDDSYNIIDVGAAGGLPPRFRWMPFLKKIHLTAFEPDDRDISNFESQQNVKKVDFQNVALSDKGQELKLYLTLNNVLSSIYEPDVNFLKKYPDTVAGKGCQIIDVKDINSMTMDSFSHNNKKIYDYLKIDTQGSELDILKGSEKTLKNIFCVEIEVEFQKMYRNQPVFSDVDIFLREMGFEIFDLRKEYWNLGQSNTLNKGQLIWGDALYFKSIDSLLSEQYSGNYGVNNTKIYKYLSTLLLFGYFDVVRHHLENRSICELLNERQINQFLLAVNQMSDLWYVPNFFKKHRIIKRLKRMVDRLWYHPNQGTFGSDDQIGN